MNTGENYKKLVYGSGLSKFTAKLSVLKSWLQNPEMKKSHLKAKRPKVIQYADFLLSTVLYGSTLEDYLIFEFYNKSHQEKKSYLTGNKQHKILNKVNNKNNTDIFTYKTNFIEYFSSYLGRETFTLNLDGKNTKDAKRWLNDKSTIYAKPSKAGRGIGVTRLNVENGVEETINYCLNNNLNLLEEAIVQHEDMNILYPDAVNTVRFITFIENEKVKILGARLRIGNGGYIDNAAAGGIFASIDIDTGVLDSLAYNKLGEKFEKHPITNHPIEGFKIPYWNDIVEMCKKAAFEAPDVRSVGWDVAITEKGPLLIEGNDRWCRVVWQVPKEQGLYHLIK